MWYNECNTHHMNFPKNVAHGEIQWHCRHCHKVFFEWQWHQHQSHGAASRPWQTSLSWRFFEHTTYISSFHVLVWYVWVYSLYGRIRNLNRRNMCEYMCEFENRIKNNTNTPHHYWDNLSHLSCCPPKCTPPVRLFWQSAATWAKGGSWPSWMVSFGTFFRTFFFKRQKPTGGKSITSTTHLFNFAIKNHKLTNVFWTKELND